MAGTPTNFGAKFMQTGKFGKKGRQQIKNAGFANVNDFLNQAGVSREHRQLKPLQSTLSTGYQAPQQPTQPPAAQTQDPVQPQNPSLGQGLMQQSTDLTNAGANILNQGNPASQPLLNAGANYTTGAQQDLGKVDYLAGAARAQGQNILNTLTQQQQAANQDIQNYFNAQPLDTLRSNLSQLNSAAQASGRTNARSTNELGAELQRGLIRDQANALLGSNNQFRAQTIGELGSQRALDQALSGMYSGQGISQGQLGNQALNAGGNLVNATNQLGADIFNTGFQNQLGTIGLINNLSQQNFNTQNQLLQKALANITGARQNRQSMDLMRQQLEAQQQGGGFLSGLMGGLSGGLL